MPWFKVDDNFYDHPKVDELSLEAVGLWTLCGTYSAKQLTDGFIPARRALRMGGTERAVRELIEAGLWLTVDGGFQFHDWDAYQPTKDKVEREREAARERQAKKRRNELGQYSEPLQVESKRSHAVTSQELLMESPRESHHPDPTRPVPSNKDSRSSPAEPDGFSEFWAAYPKKIAKKAAVKVYERAIKDTDPADIINGTKRYAEHVKAEKTERKFIKSPDGWLNAGRWEDDISVSTSTPTKNPLWDT